MKPITKITVAKGHPLLWSRKVKPESAKNVSICDTKDWMGFQQETVALSLTSWETEVTALMTERKRNAPTKRCPRARRCLCIRKPAKNLHRLNRTPNWNMLPSRSQHQHTPSCTPDKIVRNFCVCFCDEYMPSVKQKVFVFTANSGHAIMHAEDQPAFPNSPLMRFNLPKPAHDSDY